MYTNSQIIKISNCLRMNEYLQQQNEQKTQQLWEFNKKIHKISI